MDISIRDFKKCTMADFSVDKITLLLGNNGVAKSTIIKAIALGASGIVPTAQKRKAMLRHGCSRARVAVGGNSIDLPNDEAITSDGTVKASKYAVGLTKFAEEKPAELTVYLQKLLKTEPTQEDLYSELQKAGVSAEMQAAVWSRVQRQGWNDSHKHYSEQGRDLKSRWHGITGLTWGIKQAATWTPKEWEPELDGKSETTLNEELVQQRETLEGMIRFEAVNEEQLSKLQEEYCDIDVRLEALRVAKADCAEKKAALEQVNKKLQSLPRPGVPVKTVNCKKCKTAHVYSNGDIILAPEQPGPEVIETQKAEIKEVEHQASIAGQLYAAAEAAQRRCDLDVHNAENAKKKFDELMAKPKHDKPDPVLQEKQRALVARCENRLQAFKQKAASDIGHKAVVDNQKVIDVLAPDGFRQRHSAAAIAKFNQEFLSYENVKGFQEIRLASNLDITYGGVLYEDCSDGEKWKINAVFQIALARIEGDSILLFDKAEELDKPGKSGFVSMLAAVGIPAVIAYTGTSREDSIDLESYNLGNTYWLEDGVMKPLKKEAVTA